MSFTDDAGNEESLGSEATATVANPIAGICDRTERVQDAILGMLNGVDDCADVTGSHLAGITLGLSISKGLYDRQALSLESGDFAGLVNIEHLAIYNHTMDALPEDIFDGLGSLESLDLSNNEIAALPEDVFDGLGNLRSLRLDSNDLASPPEDVFDGLDSLTDLDIEHQPDTHAARGCIRRTWESDISEFGKQSWHAVHSNREPGAAGRQCGAGQSCRRRAVRHGGHFVGDGWNAVRSLRYHRRRDRW